MREREEDKNLRGIKRLLWRNKLLYFILEIDLQENYIKYIIINIIIN